MFLSPKQKSFFRKKRFREKDKILKLSVIESEKRSIIENEGGLEMKKNSQKNQNNQNQNNNQNRSEKNNQNNRFNNENNNQEN